MTTEYRPGIPSHAHIEAATRLGLLWEDPDLGITQGRWRLEIRDGVLFSDYATAGSGFANWNSSLDAHPIAETATFRPIRPDGTPVDWETLDAEVARVAGAAGTVQPQGFRADLWRRICRHFTGREICNMVSFEQIVSLNDTACHFTEWYWDWCDMPTNAATQTDILARWTVYQELKPLYDIVDGKQAEVAMPADVYNECRNRAGWRGESDDRWSLRYNNRLEAVGIGEVWHGEGLTLFERVNMRNFATVLDAVAEARVRSRQGQTSAEHNSNQDQALRQQLAEQSQPRQTTARLAAQTPPEPRRFADVRPDRHGWRWWRTSGSSVWGDNTRIEIHNNQFRVHLENLWRPWAQFMLQNWLPTDRTVIPTDEQGNPVSWDSIGPADQGRTDPVRAIVGSPPTSAELPRFTADELDDVDHTATTKLDEATLRRGKLPTVEQIAKYREVRAKRTGGTVADALKESRIDCEVAQYVLERWAGGLGDEESRVLIETASRFGAEHKVGTHLPTFAVDSRIQWYTQNNQTLDTSEKPSPTVQRERQEAEERRQRLAELRQRLAAERAAQLPEMAKEGDAVSRFALIEPDPQADPTASIRAWEARQAAAKVPVPARPAAAPRRPAIEVVDAETDGLSRVEVVTALFGRAFNGGC